MTNEGYQEFEILVERIKEFKERKCLTFEKIGNALGVNKSHIYRVMNMEVFPSFQFLIQLARYMEVSFASLFTLPEEENEPAKLPVDQHLEAIQKHLKQIGLSATGVTEVVEHIQDLLQS